MWCKNLLPVLKAYRAFSNVTPTIYALSSGKGKCGVAVIRVSGLNAGKAILKMTNLRELPKPRMAILKYLQDPVTLEKLDKGLILWFPGPKSFTGEDCCEFQVHGGPAVVSSILSALNKLEHFKPAEPGEFTKRAFFNGKLDLTEVEGLGDLIHADTEMQRKQALLQMEGTLSKLYNSWRNVLLQNVAHIEAFIDFSEEENIEENIMEMANKELHNLKKEIEKHLADGRKGERLRYGVVTTIIGEPNAGKSSLFNALCQRPAAIVTPIAGTTRDLIELQIDVNGYPLILTDTAGLRKEVSDIIEKEGISRAHSTIKNSDLLLIVIDSTILNGLKISLSKEHELHNFLISYLKNLSLDDLGYNSIELLQNPHESERMQDLIFIFNKIDLLSEEEKLKLQKATKGKNISCISCTTEDNFSSFIEILTVKLRLLCGNPSGENPSLTQTRHRYHLTKCCEFLREYFKITEQEQIALAAYELQKSLNQLGKITGKIGSDEILDIIFKDFCIGK